MPSSNPYFNPEFELLDRGQIEALQLKRLQDTVAHCYHGSPFYRKRLDSIGVKPESIKSLDDLRRIPFTTKQDLRDTYPFGIASIPLDQCVRLHSSSGTTGNPTVVLHSAKDLHEGANALARSLWMVGCRPEDVFQNTSGYGMFTGGLGFQYAAEMLGMLTVPAGAGNTLRQLKFFTDFGTTVVHAIPSYAARLYEVMCQQGIDPRRDTKLKIMAIGAEPHSEDTRRRIEETLGLKAYNSFGMSEMCGPGVAFECKEQNGLHIWEDSYIVEIIDPQTLEPVPDGEFGEMVLTTLDREGMPLVRYRTRDITRIIPGPCPCGRTHRRLDRFRGRSDDMFIVKGVNIYPMQIEKILMEFPQLGGNYLITVDTVGSNDEIFIDAELDDLFTDDYTVIQALNKDITRKLKDEILVTPRVRLVDKRTIPQSEGKAVRLIDKRKKF